MIIITKYAKSKLLNILSSNLHISSGYGSPPIFYWYRNVIEESRNIENCHRLRRGEYKYKLGFSLGIAHVKCEYVERKRVYIITDYEINTEALFSWHKNTSQSGIVPIEKKKYEPKGFCKLTTKPLFGYTYVINNNKEYNLVDAKGRLITQWFIYIKPLSKPYGKHQIIAYVNIGGYMCALGKDGKTYNLGRLWNNAYLNECINILLNDILGNIHQQNLNESKNNIIRLNEKQLYSIVREIVQYLVD